MAFIEIISVGAYRLEINPEDYVISVKQEHGIKKEREDLFYFPLNKVNGDVLHVGDPGAVPDGKDRLPSDGLIDWESRSSYYGHYPQPYGWEPESLGFRFRASYIGEIKKLITEAVRRSDNKTAYLIVDHQHLPGQDMMIRMDSIEELFEVHEKAGLRFDTLYRICGESSLLKKPAYRHIMKENLYINTSLSMSPDIHLYACLRLGSVNSMIASFKYTEFENVLTSARHAMLRSRELDNDAEFISYGDSYIDPGMESQKYSILQYNACYDHLLSVIYFAFDFNDDIDSPGSYEENLYKCRFSKNSGFYKKFGRLSEENPAAAELFAKLKEFYDREPLNRWANMLKHTGNLWLGARYPDIFNYKIEEIHKSYKFDTEFILGTTFYSHEVERELIKQNNRIVEFADFLYSFIGFDRLHDAGGKLPVEGNSIEKKFSAADKQ